MYRVQKKIYGIVVVVLVAIGCEEILIEESVDDAVVDIIAPLEGTNVENTTVNFSWNETEFATNYRLQIAKPNFENASQVVLDTILNKTNFTTELVEASYEWRVQAQNASSTSGYSQAEFQVISNTDFPSSIVALNNPVDNYVTNQEKVTLSWEEVKDATLYRVQLLGANDTVEEEQTIAATSLEVTFAEGTGKWQVRAENSTQNTLYVTRNFTLDTELPKDPTPSTPVDDSNQDEVEVEFSWAREAVEGSREFDKLFIFSDEALTQPVVDGGEELTSPATKTLTAGTTYYWRVQSFDEAGNQSNESAVFSFTIN